MGSFHIPNMTEPELKLLRGVLKDLIKNTKGNVAVLSRMWSPNLGDLCERPRDRLIDHHLTHE